MASDLDETHNEYLPEPWRTAQDYLDCHGDLAEYQVTRLAAELRAEGNHEDAAKLNDVLDALQMLRRTERDAKDAIH
ncbi:MAG: hypothetical protein P4L99_21535 [Chthoniobacter sp.]|nr:hypothetical protein [Chthoniobacter sp.]